MTLQFDLHDRGYAVIDNLLITAADAPGGGLTAVPARAGLPLLASAMVAIGLLRRRKG